MATTTSPQPWRMDEFGIERATSDSPTKMELFRMKHPWFDHVMRAWDRYKQRGGDQYAAGITYFSVLSLFPLLMLVFAVAAMVLASRPELLEYIQSQISSSVDDALAETINTVIDTAIDQAGTVAGIGGLTALWSGLGWINNLRYGVSKMWMYPAIGNNLFLTKLKDLGVLIGLFVVLVVAFAVTAVGSSGLTWRLIELVNLDHVPGISVMTFVVAVVVGLLANFVMFWWMLSSLPRGQVPLRSGLQAAVIGAVAFEILKQIGSMFFSSALQNPAGVTFGPIIGIMVLFYIVWRITLMCSAWAATTEESLAIATQPAPPPAVINVRGQQPPRRREKSGLLPVVGVGALVGAVVSLWRR